MSETPSQTQRHEFTVASRRVIRLQAIDQWRTYEGLLLGTPSREMNQDMMDRLVKRYTRPNEYGTPLLLEPEQRRLEVPPNVHVSGTPSKLPRVTCVARLISDSLLGDRHYIWSVLRVIWFQDEFAFPIAERALAQIDAIDWETHATGWEP